MVNSKDVFKVIESDFVELKSNGNLWCDNNDVVAASRTRKYSKKIIKNMRLFVKLSVKEAAKIKPVVAEVPKETPVEEL